MFAISPELQLPLKKKKVFILISKIDWDRLVRDQSFLDVLTFQQFSFETIKASENADLSFRLFTSSATNSVSAKPKSNLCEMEWWRTNRPTSKEKRSTWLYKRILFFFFQTVVWAVVGCSVWLQVHSSAGLTSSSATTPYANFRRGSATARTTAAITPMKTRTCAVRPRPSPTKLRFEDRK